MSSKTVSMFLAVVSAMVVGHAARSDPPEGSIVHGDAPIAREEPAFVLVERHGDVVHFGTRHSARVEAGGMELMTNDFELGPGGRFVVVDRHGERKYVVREIRDGGVRVDCVHTFDARSFGGEITRSSGAEILSYHEEFARAKSAFIPGTSMVFLEVPIHPAQNRGFTLVDVPVKKEKDSIADHWNSATDDLMVNGGYFTPSFAPDGYCKLDGKEIVAAVSPRLSGFVAIDKAGKLTLLARADKDKLAGYPTVFQSGPYLIDPGGKTGIRDKAGPEARRTVLAQAADGRLWIVVTRDAVSLYRLAEMLKERLPDVDRALNLDGGPSTALKMAGEEVRNAAPVRAYLVKRKSAVRRAEEGDVDGRQGLTH